MSTAIILAGGHSRRMPFDKQLIRLDDRYIAVAIADRIAPLFDRVVIVSNRPELYADSGYAAIRDQVESHGPISGFYTGMLAAAEDQDDRDDYVYFAACDMPFIDPAYIRFMRTFFPQGKDAIAVINDGHIETFNAFYHKRLTGFLAELLARGQYSLLRIYDSRDICFVPEEEMSRYNRSGRLFVNINDMQGYDRYLGDRKPEDNTYRGKERFPGDE